MENFNVVLDKWVPVINTDGNVLCVSPLEIFENDYVSFAGTAVENYCLLRFFIALSQSSEKNQPKDIDEWESLRPIFQKNVINYIDSNKILFYMFGDKPFLQSADNELSPGYKTKKLRLKESMCDGNNPIQFSTQLFEYKNVKDVVLDLIVHHIYSTTFERSFPPSRAMVYKNSPNGNINFYGQLPSLLETIWYNMIYGNNFGKPVWESRFNQSYTSTELNKLCPLTVKIKIFDDLKTMIYQNGLVYNDIVSDDSFYAIVNSNYSEKVGNTVKSIAISRPMAYKDNFKFWDGFDIILSLSSPPQSLTNFRIKRVSTLTINAVGVQISSNCGFSKTSSIKDYCYEIKNPNKIHTQQYNNFYKKCVAKTNECFEILKDTLSKQVKALRKNDVKKFLKCDDKNINKVYVNPYTSTFFNFIDNESRKLFEYDGTQEDESDWNLILKSVLETSITNLLTDDNFVLYNKVVNSIAWKSIIGGLK